MAYFDWDWPSGMGWPEGRTPKPDNVLGIQRQALERRMRRCTTSWPRAPTQPSTRFERTSQSSLALAARGSLAALRQNLLVGAFFHAADAHDGCPSSVLQADTTVLRVVVYTIDDPHSSLDG